MDAANIYSGPISKVEISTDNGTNYNDLGAIGNGNAEINFEPTNYALGDGQEKQLFGLGSVKIEIAETHAANLTLLSSAKDTDQSKLKITAMDGKVYETGPALVQYAVKRGFGDDAHILTITQKKKAIDEDDFVTITTS